MDIATYILNRPRGQFSEKERKLGGQVGVKKGQHFRRYFGEMISGTEVLGRDIPGDNFQKRSKEEEHWSENVY